MCNSLSYIFFRSVNLPIAIAKFEGHNDWKRKKMKKPMLSHDLLKQHETKLTSILSQPWLARELFIPLEMTLKDYWVQLTIIPSICSSATGLCSKFIAKMNHNEL